MYTGIYSCIDHRKENFQIISLVNNNKDHSLDSITFQYFKVSEVMWRIKKTFYLNEKRKQFEYFIRLEDSVCYIGKEAILDGRITKNIDFKQYLSLKDTLPSYFTCGVFFDANGHMKYIGSEMVIVNNKMKRLFKFIGQDIGVKSNSDNIYFFDNNFVLKKIVMSGNGVLE